MLTSSSAMCTAALCRSTWGDTVFGDASGPGGALDAFLERANALARPFDDQLIRTIASTKYQSGNYTLIK